MRSVVLWLLLIVAAAAAEYEDEPFRGIEQEDVGDVEVDEEDPDAPNDEEDVYYRRKREIHEPFDQHIRVKRCCEDRVRRSAEYIRTPRQVHQYEVHEFTDENDPSSAPYEEMLAASANHYHRVYAAPGASKSARYLNPDASSKNVLSTPSNHQPLNHAHFLPLQSNVLSGVNQPINNVPVLTLNQQNRRQLAQPSSFVSKLQGPAPFNVPAAISPVSSPEVSLASAPLVPLQQLDGDQSVAAAAHKHSQHAHVHAHSQSGGHGNHAKQFADQGGKVSRV